MATQKITIEPVTRIEGHAKITVHMKEDGNVEHAYLHINEFRGFEKFCEGRMLQEMAYITPRICGICPISHHLAAAKATDAVLGMNPPRPARLLRELMHMGQIIQSHGMHFFELAGPDLILGFDSDPATRNVVGLVQANADLTVKAVRLRKFGQEIISTLGGRRIHPTFVVPGGVNKTLSITERDQLLSTIDEMVETTQIGIQIMKDWAAQYKEDIDRFAVFPTGYLGLVTPENAWEMYDGDIRLLGQDGQQLEKFQGANYLDFIAEHVENWSYLKFPYYKPMGWPNGSYRVGPLGRLNTVDKIDTPLANAELQYFKQINNGKPVENTLYYHLARMIEVLAAVEQAHVLLNDPDITSTDILDNRKNPQGEGVGVIEAPRGTLIHHYVADEDEKLTKVNLIVSTGHNNYAMSHSVDMVAKEYINGKEVTEGLLNRVEAAVRAHDPCLSCSTHAVGQMPIEIAFIDANGNMINSIQR
ncbi:MAG: Ni/Fe hydrogenase subunit alpha [Anaerolineae bacterium]|nr:Ni/Fe hydrogenase subunit alpha [Anaerolineae bacterium]